MRLGHAVVRRMRWSASRRIHGQVVTEVILAGQAEAFGEELQRRPIKPASPRRHLEARPHRCSFPKTIHELDLYRHKPDLCPRMIAPALSDPPQIIRTRYRPSARNEGSDRKHG